jgi:hypothetical protein
MLNRSSKVEDGGAQDSGGAVCHCHVLGPITDFAGQCTTQVASENLNPNSFTLSPWTQKTRNFAQSRMHR